MTDGRTAARTDGRTDREFLIKLNFSHSNIIFQKKCWTTTPHNSWYFDTLAKEFRRNLFSRSSYGPRKFENCQCRVGGRKEGSALTGIPSRGTNWFQARGSLDTSLERRASLSDFRPAKDRLKAGVKSGASRTDTLMMEETGRKDVAGRLQPSSKAPARLPITRHDSSSEMNSNHLTQLQIRVGPSDGYIHSRFVGKTEAEIAQEAKASTKFSTYVWAFYNLSPFLYFYRTSSVIQILLQCLPLWWVGHVLRILNKIIKCTRDVNYEWDSEKSKPVA